MPSSVPRNAGRMPWLQSGACDQLHFWPPPSSNILQECKRTRGLDVSGASVLKPVRPAAGLLAKQTMLCPMSAQRC